MTKYFILSLFFVLLYGPNFAHSENSFAESTLTQESHVFLSSFVSTEKRLPSLEGVYPIQTGTLTSGNEMGIDLGIHLIANANEAELSDSLVAEKVMPDQMSDPACKYFQSSHSCCSNECTTDQCCVTSNDCGHSCEEYDDCCECCCEEEEEYEGSGGASSSTSGGGGPSSGFFSGSGGSGSSSDGTDATDTTGATETSTTGTTTTGVVPEPQTYLLLGSALLVVMWLKKRRKALHTNK